MVGPVVVVVVSATLRLPDDKGRWVGPNPNAVSSPITTPGPPPTPDCSPIVSTIPPRPLPLLPLVAVAAEAEGGRKPTSHIGLSPSSSGASVDNNSATCFC